MNGCRSPISRWSEVKMITKFYQLSAVIALAGLLPIAYPAQTPVRPVSSSQDQSPPPSGTAALPNLLTLEAATQLFMQRNLAVEAARLEVSVAAAERVAASLRPRPGV